MDNSNYIEEDEIDIRQLIDTLRRNKFRIFLITFLSVLVTFIYLYRYLPIYSTDVTIALDSPNNVKMQDILPGELFLDSVKQDEKLQLAKVTLESRKFIGQIIDKLGTSKRYFIHKNFKNVEVENFSNLKIDLKIKDEELSGTLFKIIPQNDNKFLLKIDDIEYSSYHDYNKEIKNDYFSLRVVRLKNRENPLLSSFEENLTSYIGSMANFIDNRAYIFQTFSKKDQIEKVLKNMSVSILSDSILKITYQDTLPSRAQKVAQEIAESYIDYNLANKTAELEQTLEFLDKQIIDIKNKLKQKGEKLKKYQQKNSTITAIESGETILKFVENKKELVEKITSQIRELKAFRDSLRRGVLSTVSIVSAGIDTSSIQSLIETYRDNDEKIRALRFQQNNIDKAVTSNPQINAMIDELKEKEDQLVELQNNFTDVHPQVIDAQESISDIRSRIHATIIANLQKLQRDKDIAKSTILSNMLMVQRNLENKLRQINSDIREKKALLQSLPATNMVNQDLQRNFTVSEDIYTFLLQKKIEAQISKASIIANTKIIEDAILPEKPIKPNKKLILLVSLIVGFILSIIYVFLREFLDTKVRTVKDIEALTDVPIYGTLPLNNNERFFKEALRNVRTNLQFVLPEDKRCTHILVSSTIAGEGKTTVSAGLAKIISRADKKVLALDLDLRKPRLHKELKLSNKVGVSNYLANDIELEDIIQPIHENLDFISAGTIPPNPSELLMSKRFENMIGELSQHYDYIIFDTAPIGSVTDANILIKYTDILLLVVRADKAEKMFIENFNRMVKEKKVKSAGIILNGVKLYKNKSYGYGYGGYGYGYGGYDYGYGEEKK